ncbi:hypothetical protein [Archangium lansingense]|uniref:Uncharacterized protein n=1 Tax=Archangium lansingense TaxID=2995310 RepID=A0ABT4A7W7_9BACT|nr:hypothetical protein [Archangium lansinium]MCY1077710.1 hypothetical protein [Archangium lansinium]
MMASGRWLYRWGAVLALAVMLTSQAALAERVAVSAIEGDKNNKLRAQVTGLLRKTRKVQVLPPAAWAKAAAKQKLRGQAAVDPRAVARLAPKLKVDAVLTGSAGRTYSTFNARLLDENGQEVWTGEFVLQRGLLPKYEARKFTQAVLDAVKAANAPAVAPPPAPEQPPVADSAPVPAPQPAPTVEQPAPEPHAAGKGEPEAVKPARPLEPEPSPAQGTASAPKSEATPRAPKPALVPESKPVPAWVELDEESHTYLTELEGSGGGFPEEEGVAAEGRMPPRLKVLLGAPVTWRRYCARPGATSCAEYDARPPEQQVGDITDFTSNAPYVGIAAEAEVFPLAHWPTLLRGVGLTLAYQRSFARTTVQVSTPVGETPEREVYATDTAYGAMLAYRYFFDLGKEGTPLFGYAGLRVGALGREFDVGEQVETPLPVVHRFYPAVGLDVSVPLMRLVRIQGSGQLFLRPNPGQSPWGDADGSLAAEVRDYGEAVSSLGWAAELGVAGDIWGPIGYSARFRLESYKDRYTGQGTRRGWTEGGVAEESYSSIIAGVTASW